MRPTIDDSLLSPSGRMSKRAREAAMKREAKRIIQPGTFDNSGFGTAAAILTTKRRRTRSRWKQIIVERLAKLKAER